MEGVHEFRTMATVGGYTDLRRWIVALHQSDTPVTLEKKDNIRPVNGADIMREEGSMKCPKCKIEVGDQPLCPNCGSTLKPKVRSNERDEYLRRTTIPSSSAYQNSGYPPQRRERDVTIQNIHTKLNLVLILQCGIFALVILTLVILALK